MSIFDPQYYPLLYLLDIFNEKEDSEIVVWDDSYWFHDVGGTQCFPEIDILQYISHPIEIQSFIVPQIKYY